MSENNDTRIGRLESELAEQKKITEKNTELLTEIAAGLKAMREGNAKEFTETMSYACMTKPMPGSVGAALASGKLKVSERVRAARDVNAVVDRGRVIGACMVCATPIRDRRGSDARYFCIVCGPRDHDVIFYGRLCVDCPHVEGAHRNNGPCEAHAAHNVGGVGNVPCACGSFRVRADAQIEADERKILMRILCDGANVNEERLAAIRAALPPVVFFRASHERLDELARTNESGGTLARDIGKQAGAAFQEMRAEQAEMQTTRKIAEKAATPREEYAAHTKKIGMFVARGKKDNDPELLELTRKAADAWSRLSSAERKAVKDELSRFDPRNVLEEEDEEPENADAERVPGGLPVLEEKLPPLDPTRMRAVVLQNQDEERADMTLVFQITRSQAAILEWGLKYPEVMGVKGRFETIEDLSANMLLPSFNYMLKHIAVARGKVPCSVNDPEEKHRFPKDPGDPYRSVCMVCGYTKRARVDETKPGPGKDA